MRATFSDELVRIAKADSRFLLLTGDHGYALFDAFRKECPDQYLNCGIAEQNMVGVAAGLAKAGFRPIVYGLAAFIPVRVLEQIKIDVCYENLPVTFVGDGAGVVYAQLGTSHQSTEDVAALRGVPAIEIYSPADRFELMAVMQQIARAQAPIYLRFGKADVGDVHADKISADVKTLQRLIDGTSANLIIASGSMARPALNVARHIGGWDVYTVPCIKPLASDELRKVCMNRECIAVIEEHSIHGGLGGAVAEQIVGGFTGSFLQIGIEDRFSEQCGSYDFLLRSHGIDEESIISKLTAATVAYRTRKG
ncbi:MAG: transketolase C-terminal domain-containing protein [Nevskia sp.]